MSHVNDAVRVPDVEVIRETEVALLCRIAGVIRFIPQAEVRPGSVTRPGDRGSLILSRRCAVELGLA